MFENLLNDARFDPVALVRSEKSGRQLIKSFGCGLERVVVCDVVTQLDQIPEGLQGVEAIVICTSAVPLVNRMSLLRTVLKIPYNLLRRKKMVDFRGLRFRFKNGQYPEKVDYEGQKAQIDLAKQVGAKQVVIVRYVFAVWVVLVDRGNKKQKH